MRCLTHRFRSAAEDYLRLTEEYLHRSAHDGLEPRTTKSVDREGRHFLRDTGLKADMAGQVDRIPRSLQSVAENYMVDALRGDSRLLDRRASGHCAKFGRSQILQAAAKGTKGR